MKKGYNSKGPAAFVRNAQKKSDKAAKAWMKSGMKWGRGTKA